MGHLTDAAASCLRDSGDRTWADGEVVMTETFQITREQAAAYEELFVPALFAQWAPMLVDLAGIRDGDRVLDVACGTGIAARTAAERVGRAGSVVGLDLNPAMLEVAARIRPDIEWREGDAAELPFGDESFDAVLCQSAVFFFPDVDRAFSEMTRVLRRGGVAAIQTYAALPEQPGFQEFDAIVRRIVPGEALDLLDTYWSMGDLPALCAALNRAGLRIVETRTTVGAVQYGTVENLVETEIKGTPLVDRLSQNQIDQILTESATILNSFVTPQRGLEMPITSHLVAARRPGQARRIQAALGTSSIQRR
jgi:SAM-dependent methyltransferase